MGSAWVSYKPNTGWLTVWFSPYHAWQGHISELPNKYDYILYVGA